MYNVSKHERLRPLFRNCVVLRFICSVDDGNAVGVAAGNGEDDLRWPKKVCSVGIYGRVRRLQIKIFLRAEQPRTCYGRWITVRYH